MNIQLIMMGGLLIATGMVGFIVLHDAVADYRLARSVGEGVSQAILTALLGGFSAMLVFIGTALILHA